MNSSISKILNFVLSLLAIILFLCTDFIDLGHNKTYTGADLIKKVEDGDSEIWPLLFVMVPIIQIFIKQLLLKKIHIIICSSLMLIPLLIALDKVKGEYLSVGFYIYLFIAILMIVIPLIDIDNIYLNKSNDDDEDKINKSKCKNYSNEELQDIINNPTIYNNSLVEACKNELDIRINSKIIMHEIETYSDEKIEDILTNSESYSEVLIFCCDKIKKERYEKKIEEERLEKERLEKEKREKLESLWLKWRWIIIGSIVVLVSIILLLYYTSNGYYLKSGKENFYSNNYEVAIEKLLKIEDSNYNNYLEAKKFLFDSYVYQVDLENANSTLKDIYNAVQKYDINELNKKYDATLSNDAYLLCANAIMSEEFDLEKDYETALKLYEMIDYDSHRGMCLYKMELYDDAFDILNNCDDLVSNIYKGIMYLKGQGCSKSLIDAYKSFKEADLEDYLDGTSIEGKKTTNIQGYIFDVNIIKEYFVSKGDLSLIYGKLTDYSTSYEEGINIARECYAKAANLFPSCDNYALRHKYVENLFNIKGKKENTGSYNWTYVGEYIEDYSYMSGIRPCGYGIYYTYDYWIKSKSKVVIGNFRSVGNNFSWGKDALIIYEYDDKTKYEIGYFDTKGNYHLLNRY